MGASMSFGHISILCYYFSYKQCFDLEGESGIVIRGIGTAVTLAKLRDPQVSPLGASPLKE